MGKQLNKTQYATFDEILEGSIKNSILAFTKNDTLNNSTIYNQAGKASLIGKDY